MSVRVYKFLSCKFGLKAIRERRIKISAINSLNDPYELLPFDLSGPELRRAALASRDEIARDRGLLCFSRNWHNPVLWAHYSDCHRGVCLGFEVPDDFQQAVRYVDRPMVLTYLNLEVANQMLFTKYVHWQYEEEIRMWATLEEKSGEHYFMNFSDKLRLDAVVLGARCHLSGRKLQQVLGSKYGELAIRKARAAYTEFKMVADETWTSGI